MYCEILDQVGQNLIFPHQYLYYVATIIYIFGNDCCRKF